MTLPILLSQDADTPLRDLLHPFDLYGLELELHDRGIDIAWPALLAMETCGEVQGLCGELTE